jgi:cytochrome c
MREINQMRIDQVILAAALLGAYFIGYAAADATDSQAYTINPDAREELIVFVEEARNLALMEGKDKALTIFNDPKGEFVRGDLYIIAYDFKESVWPIPTCLRR